ncbi:MAG: hypothetical protein E7411_07585 [Ruminococcaceae bacterium]|nr:hypothetical protein [Oscillospiraceae bacterium]
MRKIALFLSIIIFVFGLTACDSVSDSSSNGKIKMPNSTEYYIGSEWTIESLTGHLKELGFTNIRSVPCEPDDDNYEINIREMYIQTGMFSTDPWEAGEEYKPDAEISIYYNEIPLLTIDNCPDLKTALYSTDIDYMTFANKYDGRYVEFDAYVYDHITYMGDTSHIIDVAGGDGSSEGAPGLIVRIGDRTWGSDIDESVEKGDLVKVSGRIDASQCEYYKHLYVECRILEQK